MDLELEIRRCRERAEYATFMGRHVLEHSLTDEEDAGHLWQDQRGRLYIRHRVAAELDLLDKISHAIRREAEAIDAGQGYVQDAEAARRTALSLLTTVNETIAEVLRLSKEGEDTVAWVRKESEKITKELQHAGIINEKINHDPG